MRLEFKRFARDVYPEYATWFVDPELDRHLGPMDTDWLDAVMSEPESEGVTWAVYRGSDLVAVVETFFDPRRPGCVIITGVATKPSLRRQGIAAAALEQLFRRHTRAGVAEYVALISARNQAARQLAEDLGFAPLGGEPDEHGYIEYRRQL